MAQKSKTQRAKASAARAARKEQLDAAAAAEAAAQAAQPVADEPKKSKLAQVFSKPAADQADAKASAKASAKATEKPKAVEKAKPKKERFRFIKSVRSEMKRVTWPTRQEVIRWSVVVVMALLFFGVFVAVLDNWVVTPILVGIAGLGA